MYTSNQAASTMKFRRSCPVSSSLRVGLQQDCHEYWTFLIDSFKQPSLYAVFNVQKVQIATCDNCHDARVVQELDSDTIVFAHIDAVSVQLGIAKDMSGQYYNDHVCIQCNVRDRMMTVSKFKQKPISICVLLGRVGYDVSGSNALVRIDRQIIIDQQIDLSSMMLANTNTESYQYDLYAAVFHKGTAKGGHYYSLVKPEGSEVCYFTDVIDR
jgi:ubiquitin C-terminal hydrolase